MYWSSDGIKIYGWDLHFHSLDFDAPSSGSLIQNDLEKIEVSIIRSQLIRHKKIGRIKATLDSYAAVAVYYM